MTFDYAQLRDGTAETLLARFGMTATLSKPGTPTGPAYDPVPGTATDYTVTVVNKRINYRDRDGTYIQATDRLFLLSTDTTTEPELDDTITVGSDTYRIVDITPVQTGSVIMLWYVLCRK